MKQPVLGVIVGNRGFFPGHLSEKGRQTVLALLEREGIKAIALGPDDSPYGSVESVADSQKLADLFKAHREEIIGVLVTLPNFGDERAIANVMRWSGLDVPILVHAFPDETGKMSVEYRRDSFCGKMSACNNLKQYGFKYSLTTHHTEDPDSPQFLQDLRDFVATCQVVAGLKGARVGLIGARPANFITVRFSEKLFERAGISTETVDLSEIFGRAKRIEGSPKVAQKLEQIRSYVNVANTPADALEKMARLGVVIDDWMADNKLAASAIQCWTSMEEFYGVVPCTLMSIMSNGLMPSACETDIAGVVGMYAMALASCKPERAGRLEQQLRRGPRQVRRLPLL